MTSLAPIVLFTYRRVPYKLIDSLLKNSLSKKCELIIYSDGNKDNDDKEDITEVRKYLKTIEGFKKIKIIESKTNKGLANSIIDGVTHVIENYGKVIVLEDDLIVSSDFLEYMNDALDLYKNDKKIWSISGYGPKLPCLENYEKDLYLSPRGSSWGWATWKDRWDIVDWNVKDFVKLKNNKQLRKEFELGGNDLYKMLELQILGEIDSWLIRWAFSSFINKTYTVYPTKSKIVNDGFNDGLGTHNAGNNNKWIVQLSNKPIEMLELNVDTNIVQCFKDYHNLKLFTRVGYFLKKYGGYKTAQKVIQSVKRVK